MSYKFLLVSVFVTFWVVGTQAQSDSSSSERTKSLHLELRMGIGFDAFEAGFDKERKDRRDYADLKDPLIKTGMNSGIELMYNWNDKNLVSIGLDYFFWKELYGDGNDPLLRWKDQRREKERYIFTLTWSHNVKHNWQYGFGIVYQGQTLADPGYRLLGGNAISTSAVPYKPWFPDIGFSARIKKFWKLTYNFDIGLTAYTHWLAGIGFETSAINVASRLSLNNVERTFSSLGEAKTKNISLEIGTGPLVLLRYTGILKSNVGTKFGYNGADIEGISLPMGMANRYGMKYEINKLALVLNYRSARYKELFGLDADPAELWSAGRKVSYIRMLDASINYIFYSKNRSDISIGAGLLRSVEDNSRPFYTVNPDGTLEDISSIVSPREWETGIQANLTYTYDLGDAIKVGLNVSGNFYNEGRGLQSLPVNAFVSIPIF